MSEQIISPEALALLKSIKGKRARIVVEQILKHGSISTEQLKTQYGYDHPPRAIRDVKDQGVPLTKRTVVCADKRRIAEYVFGDLSRIRTGRVGGRTMFTKAFKAVLVEKYGSACGVCGTKLDPRYLQIDHRVPYEVMGDRGEIEQSAADFMLVCGSCNRAKSWSCEHCKNWTVAKDPRICDECYWANPLHYPHIAMTDARRLDLTWMDGEVKDYDSADKLAKKQGKIMPDFVKQAMRKALKPKD
jgi:hypothetical protein